MVDLRRLHDDALTAIAAGDWATAAGHYAALEKAKSGEGIWPLKLGECLRKLGKSEEAVKAFTRALTSYTLEKTYSKAAAVCKLILEIEPRNRQILQILGCLHDQRREAAAPAPSPRTPTPQVRRRESDAFPVEASVLKAERAERRSLTAEPAVALPADRGAEDQSSFASAPGLAASISPVPGTGARSPSPDRPLPRVVLPRTEFFSALDERQLRMVNQRARLVQLAPGQILFAQGEPADALLLVASGRIAVLLPREVARLERGDFFGEEVAILPDQPRLATLRAVEASQVLWLGRDLVADLVAESPALLEILAARLRERLLAMLAHTSPMLASLAVAERSALLARFHFVEVERGNQVEEPGVAAGLFVLLAGTAVIALAGEPLARLEFGDTFGETVLLDEGPARATATASDKCFFLHLPRAKLELLRTRFPDMAAHLTAVAAQRLRQIDELVTARARRPGPPADAPRVLLIHGEPRALRAYQDAFIAVGLRVDAAGQPEPSSKLIAGERYDVVLCDVELLARAGVDLLGELRQRDLDVPILLISRDASLDTAGVAARYGVIGSFVEPIVIGELMRSAARAVQFHRLTRLRREARSLLDPSGEWMGDIAGLELHFGTALSGLWMAFQPIVSTSARQVFAFEALLRSSEAVLGNPVAVLRAAERLQRVHDVGRIARDNVADSAARAAEAPTLFVNLHRQDLLDQHLLDPCSRLSGIAPNVILEITERTPFDQVTDLRVRVAALRSLGYRFAIDNVGAGHAGLDSLAQMEPDIAKLDIALVRGIDQDSVKQNLVGGMLGVCRDMNIQVICEGVETACERDTLVRLGADLMQGYLFARPGPPFPSVDLSSLDGGK